MAINSIQIPASGILSDITALQLVDVNDVTSLVENPAAISVTSGSAISLDTDQEKASAHLKFSNNIWQIEFNYQIHQLTLSLQDLIQARNHKSFIIIFKHSGTWHLAGSLKNPFKIAFEYATGSSGSESPSHNLKITGTSFDLPRILAIPLTSADFTQYNAQASGILSDITALQLVDVNDVTSLVENPAAISVTSGSAISLETDMEKVTARWQRTGHFWQMEFSFFVHRMDASLLDLAYNKKHQSFIIVFKQAGIWYIAGSLKNPFKIAFEYASGTAPEESPNHNLLIKGQNHQPPQILQTPLTADSVTDYSLQESGIIGGVDWLAFIDKTDIEAITETEQAISDFSLASDFDLDQYFFDNTNAQLNITGNPGQLRQASLDIENGNPPSGLMDYLISHRFGHKIALVHLNNGRTFILGSLKIPIRWQLQQKKGNRSQADIYHFTFTSQVNVKLFTGDLSAILNPVSLLLDDLTLQNIFSIYRRLRTDYSGSLIRLRRDSDNAEQDFGFTSENLLDLDAIATFKGADRLFCTKIYDQSGNGNDAYNSNLTYQWEFHADCSLANANAPALPGLEAGTSNDNASSYRLLIPWNIGTGEYIFNNVKYTPSTSNYSWLAWNAYETPGANHRNAMDQLWIRKGGYRENWVPDFAPTATNRFSSVIVWRNPDSDVIAIHDGGTPNTSIGNQQSHVLNPVTENMGDSECWMGKNNVGFYFEGFAASDFESIGQAALESIGQNQYETFNQ